MVWVLQRTNGISHDQDSSAEPRDFHGLLSQIACIPAGGRPRDGVAFSGNPNRECSYRGFDGSPAGLVQDHDGRKRP